MVGSSQGVVKGGAIRNAWSERVRGLSELVPVHQYTMHFLCAVSSSWLYTLYPSIASLAWWDHQQWTHKMSHSQRITIENR